MIQSSLVSKNGLFPLVTSPLASYMIQTDSQGTNVFFSIQLPHICLSSFVTKWESFEVAKISCENRKLEIIKPKRNILFI